MNSKFISIIAVISIIAISGCVEVPGLDFLWGGFTREKEAPKDVLVVKNLKVVPSEPVPADSKFNFGFYVENIAERKEAKNVEIFAYDWGRCEPKNVNTRTNKKGPIKIYPGSTEVVKWEFKSPSNKELGYLSGKCPIRFLVNYEFDAFTQAEAMVVSQKRLEEASRAGEQITVSPEEVKGRGPIKIDIEFGTRQPFPEGSNIPFVVRIRDKGSGLLTSLDKNRLDIKLVGTRFGEVQCRESKGSFLENILGGQCRCRIPETEGGIPIIRKESPPISCSFKIGEGITGIKTYTIKASIDKYKYPLHKEKIVRINPIYEGIGGGGEEGEGDGGQPPVTII